ncbi:MAG: L-histidine N(alpha)-methyltransferase [Pseudomonadales bacterium]
MTNESTARAAPGAAPRYRFYDLKPPPGDMHAEVHAGLTGPTKRLPPKYFYDATGSKLFEAITRLPEYYLTRTELGLFDRYQDELAAALGDGVCLVEYGSGSSRKIRKVLERARPLAYVPVDISGDHLAAQARTLVADFPWLQVYPTCADYSQPFALPEPVARLTKVGFFPGSSIGNFEPAAAEAFLRNARRTLGARSRLLIGVDRKKDVRVLEAAYDDAEGVTAAFNLNMLSHLNAALGCDFDLSGFRHEANYNHALGCVQMHLRSLRQQRVRIGDAVVTFAAGERIHTENSFKYHPEEFTALAGRAGFDVKDWWTDERGWFATFLLEASVQ